MHTFWQAAKQDTVNAVLARARDEFGEKIFLDFVGDTYTYTEVVERTLCLAAGLKEIGVQPGDTVASLLDNNVDAVLLWFAINAVGAISVPVNTAYKGEFLRHQIADSEAAVMVVEEDYALRVVEILPVLPKLTHLIHRGDSPGDHAGISVRSLREISAQNAEGIDFYDAKPGDLTMLIYTSGTTGPSKGCMISHNYACNIAHQSLLANDAQPKDIFWTALPLFHMNATATGVLKTAMIGARCAVYPRFSLSGFWPDIERSGATSIMLLGSMAPLIANAEDNDFSKRCFGQVRVVSTAPFPPELQETWRTRFGVKYTGAPGYGLSEAAMVVYGDLTQPAPPNTSGKRNEDFEVIIADGNDNELPPGEAGEILIRPLRSHVMFEGYWNRPAETQKIMRNMWLHSGDIGKFDDDGYFYFVDRQKDYLRRRGENISSFEMERSFAAHPDIADVAVHAVFSPVGEDDVKVTAVLQPNSTLTEEALCRWSLDRVPYFAVPRFIEFRRDLPRNPTGKVLKYQLRDEGCTANTWDREKSDLEIKRR
ncbi:MAG: AMP-binding protein [Pseudomonadota bacterium]